MIDRELVHPRDYHQSFTDLAKIGVLSGEFARRLAAAAGLRNRLVHEYDEIDEGRLHEAASTAIDEVPEYLRDIQRYLDRTP